MIESLGYYFESHAEASIFKDAAKTDALKNAPIQDNPTYDQNWNDADPIEKRCPYLI